MPPPAGKLVDGQETVVLTAPAAGRRRRVGERGDFIQGQHCALLSVVTLARDQRRAEGAHDARDIRAGGLHTRDALKGAQHRLVIKRAALDDDMASEISGVGELDDLVQGVFDDRIGEPGGDVLDRGPLLLRLLDVGIHEYRASRSEIHRVRRVQGALCKGLGCVAEGAREVFNERSAAGGAGLV